MVSLRQCACQPESSAILVSNALPVPERPETAFRAPRHAPTLSAGPGGSSGILGHSQRNEGESMTLSQLYPINHTRRQERREMRFPLHLPVLVRVARKEMRARSENISLGGILLAINVLIPEGSVVEVVVGVEHTPDPGVLLSALGTVLRAEPKTTGDFAVAIRLERSFELPFTRREPERAAAATASRAAKATSVTFPAQGRPVSTAGSASHRGPDRVSWCTET